MTLATHRKLILAAIICLLLYQVGLWITLVAGAVWGAGSAVVVALVSYLCARLARRGVSSSVWFLIPTLLFTVIPLVAKLWNMLSSQVGMVEMLIDLLPLLVGFVVPVVLLSIVYLQLRHQNL